MMVHSPSQGQKFGDKGIVEYSQVSFIPPKIIIISYIPFINVIYMKIICLGCTLR